MKSSISIWMPNGIPWKQNTTYWKTAAVLGYSWITANLIFFLASIALLIIITADLYGANGRICNNPYCAMCNRIERQYLARNTYRVSAPQYKKVCVNGVCSWVPINAPVIQRHTTVASTPTTIIESPAVPATFPQKTTTPPEAQPTPIPIIEEYLTLVDLTPTDILYDFGAGDGRVILAAARYPLRRAIGIERNISRAAHARARIRALTPPYRSRAWISTGDFHTLSVSKCTVATMFLYPADMQRLVPRLVASPNCRAIISYIHPLSLPSTRRVIIEDKPVYIWERTRTRTKTTTINAFEWMQVP